MRIIREGHRRILPAAAVAVALLIGGATGALGTCGPFTDAAADSFCPFVLEIFYMAITTGTTPTTYSPGDNVSRLQMAAFLSRTVDRAVQRGSRRAALKRFWTPQNALLGLTTIPAGAIGVVSDGVDVWVSNLTADHIYRISGGSGKLIESWNAFLPSNVLAAMGQILAVGQSPGGSLYQIDPRLPPTSAVTVASNLGALPRSLTFDGGRVWTANSSGSVAIVTPGATIPWSVTTVTAGFTTPWGILFDGANVWVTDGGAARLLHRLDSSGAILQSVTVGQAPVYPLFDGTNIWVPSATGASVTVVRAATGSVLATLTGNGLLNPQAAAFDGERVLVTNAVTNNVSLFKAADLSPLGSFSTGAGSSPQGVCSDGVYFWITLNVGGKVARF